MEFKIQTPKFKFQIMEFKFQIPIFEIQICKFKIQTCTWESFLIQARPWREFEGVVAAKDEWRESLGFVACGRDELEFWVCGRPSGAHGEANALNLMKDTQNLHGVFTIFVLLFSKSL